MVSRSVERGHVTRFPKWAMVLISMWRTSAENCKHVRPRPSKKWDLECSTKLNILRDFETFKLDINSKLWTSYVDEESDDLIVESRFHPSDSQASLLQKYKWKDSSSFSAISFGKSYAVRWRSQSETFRHSTFFCFLTKARRPAPDIGVLASVGSAPGRIQFSVRIKSGNATLFGKPVTRLLSSRRHWFELFDIDASAAASGEVNLHVEVNTSKHLVAPEENLNVLVFPFDSNECVTRFLPKGIWSANASQDFACLPSGEIMICLEQHEAQHIDVLQMKVSNKVTIPISSVSHPPLKPGRWMVLLIPSALDTGKYRLTVRMTLTPKPDDRWPLWQVLPIIVIAPPCALIVFFLALLASSKHASPLRNSLSIARARKVSEEQSFFHSDGNTTFRKFAQRRLRENFIKGSYSSLILLVSTAFFMAAFQLALSSWYDTQITGSRDRCRYNYECFHARFIDMPVNNLLSHIPYVVCGIVVVFMLLKVDYDMSCEVGSSSLNFHVFYALAVTEIMEGIGSTAYHICPRSLSFQFDVAMMYVIAVLSALGLAEGEVWSEDVVPAPVLFSTLILPMWCACIVGTWLDTGLSPKSAKWVYLAVVSVWCIFLLTKARLLFSSTKNSTACGLWLLRLLGASVVLGSFNFEKFTYATGKMILLVSLAVVFVMIGYQFSRRQRGGYISVRSLRLFIFRACFISVFCLAFLFFSRTPYKAGSEPWLSHNKNQPCILFGTFDAHDVWHVVSAVALALWIFVLVELRMGDYLFSGDCSSVSLALEMPSSTFEVDQSFMMRCSS